MTDGQESGAEAMPFVSEKRPCIGVFDSGFGGLTVLRALLDHLSAADFLYLGDTARLPYGSKSAETVTRYTAAAVRALVAHGAELVVIACNTASALALPQLASSSPVPLVGVIQPGAAAAATALNGSAEAVLVLATEATVASHAYAEACARHGIAAIEKACPLLVPLVEEGWTDHAVTAQVADIYLAESIADNRPAAVLLGCTHYPLLRPLLEKAAHRLLGPVPVVDSAEAVARHVCTLLGERQGAGLAAQTTAALKPEPDASGTAHLRFFATDSPQKFQRLGGRFLAREIASVTLLDLDS